MICDPSREECTDQTPCRSCPASKCAWAGCSLPAAEVVEEWPMCSGHVAEHYELLQPEKPRPPARARCGTESGYRRHLNRGEDPCDRCRQAANARRYRRDYGKRREVDAAARRCGYCGEWVYGAPASWGTRGECGACGRAVAA